MTAGRKILNRDIRCRLSHLGCHPEVIFISGFCFAAMVTTPKLLTGTVVLRVPQDDTDYLRSIRVCIVR